MNFKTTCSTILLASVGFLSCKKNEVTPVDTYCRPGKSTELNGEHTKYTYSGDYISKAETYSASGKLKSSAETDYNDKGEITEARQKDSSGIINRKITYAYTYNGTEITKLNMETFLYNNNTLSNSYSNTYNYKYDATGNLLSRAGVSTYGRDSVAFSEFHASGKAGIEKYYNFSEDSVGGNYQLSLTSINTYDADGNLLKSDTFSGQETVASERLEYTYSSVSFISIANPQPELPGKSNKKISTKYPSNYKDYRRGYGCTDALAVVFFYEKSWTIETDNNNCLKTLAYTEFIHDQCTGVETGTADHKTTYE